MARLSQNTLVRNPETGEISVLNAGTEVPKWAADMVGEHVLDGDTGSDYSGMRKAELVKEIKQRNEIRDEVNHLSTEGTVAELVAVLEADDA